MYKKDIVDIVALEKVAFLHAITIYQIAKSAKYVISEIIGLNLSVVNIF